MKTQCKFKFLTLIGTSIIVMAFSTIKGYAMTDSVSQNPALNNWTGFYGGINMGVVFNHAEIKSNHLGFTDPSGNCNTETNFSSFFPGIQIGYNRTVQNNMILGIEANLTDNFDQAKTIKCDCDFNNMVMDQFTVKTRAQGSLRGRLGYIYNQPNANLLPFVTAGVSIADLGLSYSNEGGDYYSTRSTTTGWLAGFGIEWSILKNWSLRAEYIYADYGNAVKLNLPTVYGLMDPNGKGHLNFRSSYVAVALNYWMDN